MDVFALVISTLQFILDLIKWLYDLNVYKILGSKLSVFLIKGQKHGFDNELSTKISIEKKKILIKRRLKAVFFFLKKDDYGYKNIYGSKLIFSLRKYETKDECISDIRYWKACGFIDFDGNRIETMTIIKILKEDDLLESIIACKS